MGGRGARFGVGEATMIHYFDNNNKRNKTIDLRHTHKGKKPHVHGGYYHTEYPGVLSNKEKVGVKFFLLEERKNGRFPMLKFNQQNKRKRGISPEYLTRIMRNFH